MRPYIKELEDYSPSTQHLLGCIYNMSRKIVRIIFICHFISPLQNMICTVSHKYFLNTANGWLYLKYTKLIDQIITGVLIKIWYQFQSSIY